MHHEAHDRRIDDDLLARARRALGQPTMRATIEEALRRAVEGGEAERAGRAERQRQYLQKLRARVDLRVLASGEMCGSGLDAQQERRRARR